MSLDYPLYEEMVRRKSRGRWFWRMGDYLYYIGLLTLCGSPVLYLIFTGSKAAGLGTPNPHLVAGVAGLLGICVFMLGGFLKGISYTIAKKEGIDIQRY
jgi:hypothetical protein